MASSSTTLKLYTKKLSVVWMLLLCSAFVATGIWIGRSEAWIGYLVASFFGLGIPLGLILLLPGSSYLEISDSGIMTCSLFRKSWIAWSDIDEFYVVTFKQSGLTAHKMVGFNYVESYDRAHTGRRIARFISKCEGALPDTYGKKS